MKKKLDIAATEKNNNIRTVQSESSKFASLSFDQGFPKKHQNTAPSSRSERHLTIFYINPIVVYFINESHLIFEQLSLKLFPEIKLDKLDF